MSECVKSPVAPEFFRRVRSFVRRDGRMTESQRRVLTELWPIVGLHLKNGVLDLAQVFGRQAPTIFEIGFGSGHSLLEVAKTNPDKNFIGAEMYQPGIGSLLLGIEAFGLTNIRVFHADAVEVLKQCFTPNALAGIQIFFPDPWPKRRHHKRRLIQPEFAELLANKLQIGGLLHLATDWEDYGRQMMEVLSSSTRFVNLSGVGEFAARSIHRPVITKFEQRGVGVGRAIWELQFNRLI